MLGAALLLMVPLEAAAYDPLVNALLTGYDMHARPTLDVEASQCAKGGADGVKVALYVEKLHSIDQRKQSYAIDGYFRSFWTDPRLKHASQGECPGASRHAVRLRVRQLVGAVQHSSRSQRGDRDHCEISVRV